MQPYPIALNKADASPQLAPFRAGLMHGELAIKARWPEWLPDGRPIQWIALDIPPAQPTDFDAWVIGTSGPAARRMDTLQVLSSSTSCTPIVVLLDPREDAGPWLAANAAAYHETSSSAELLSQRLNAFSKTTERPVSTGNAVLLASPSSMESAETEHWQTLFQSAGAGMLTGRLASFHSTFQRFQSLPSDANSEEKVMHIRTLLGDIQWELNNERAKQLLDLKDPVLLDHSFLGRLTPLHPHALFDRIKKVNEAGDAFQADMLVRSQSGTTRHLSMEFVIPETMHDSVLVTFLDISHRMQLEQDLRDHVDSLERRVLERTLTLSRTNDRLKLESQERERLSNQVRENLVHITQGVISAKKILEVALPGRLDLERSFSQALLIERPRDILGGDFLFLGTRQSKITLALVDSTGHGVPGSMVALLGSMLINRAYASMDDPNPSEVLHGFHAAFDMRMATQSTTPQMLGFDAGILQYDPANSTLLFAGARGDLYQIRKGEASIIRGTRASIDLLKSNSVQGLTQPEFDLHTVTVEPGDQYYLATDGIQDQFGGPKNRKLGRKRLAEMLAAHHHLEAPKREKALRHALLSWKGSNAKVDDATLVGFDVPG